MDIILPVSINTNAQLISSNVGETDYAEYSSGTTYAADDEVQVTDDGVHKVYRSAVDSNTNHYPPDNIYDDTVTPATGYWIEIGPTNKWAMFDGLSRASTSNANSIDVLFAPGALFNALALVNIFASSAHISIVDPVIGTIYSDDVSLVDLSDVDGFYSWFFYPPVRLQTYVVSDLPATPESTISISLTAPGETVVCGEAVAGIAKYIAKLQYGYSVGIKDYTTKEKDGFGNAKIEEGIYSDTAKYKISINTNKVYDVKRTLAGYRATPLVFVGNYTQQDSIIYGYYIDFEVSIQTLPLSFGTIEVEELS